MDDAKYGSPIKRIRTKGQTLTMDTIVEKVFPELIKRNEKKNKTYIDKRKMDMSFMKGILDKGDMTAMPRRQS